MVRALLFVSLISISTTIFSQRNRIIQKQDSVCDVFINNPKSMFYSDLCLDLYKVSFPDAIAWDEHLIEDEKNYEIMAASGDFYTILKRRGNNYKISIGISYGGDNPEATNSFAIDFDYVTHIQLKNAQDFDTTSFFLDRVLNKNTAQVSAAYNYYGWKESGVLEHGVKEGNWGIEHAYWEEKFGGKFKNGLKTGEWSELSYGLGYQGNLEDIKSTSDDLAYRARGVYNDGKRDGEWIFDEGKYGLNEVGQAKALYANGLLLQATFSVWMDDWKSTLTEAYQFAYEKGKLEQLTFSYSGENAEQYAHTECASKFPIDFFYLGNSPLLTSRPDGELSTFIVAFENPMLNGNREKGQLEIKVDDRKVKAITTPIGKWTEINPEGVTLKSITHQTGNEIKIEEELVSVKFVHPPKGINKDAFIETDVFYLSQDNEFFITKSTIDNPENKQLNYVFGLFTIRNKRFITWEVSADKDHTPFKKLGIKLSNKGSVRIEHNELKGDRLSLSENQFSIPTNWILDVTEPQPKDFILNYDLDRDYFGFVYEDSLFLYRYTSGIKIGAYSKREHEEMQLYNRSTFILIKDRYILYKDRNERGMIHDLYKKKSEELVNAEWFSTAPIYASMAKRKLLFKLSNDFDRGVDFIPFLGSRKGDSVVSKVFDPKIGSIVSYSVKDFKTVWDTLIKGNLDDTYRFLSISALDDKKFSWASELKNFYAYPKYGYNLNVPKNIEGKLLFIDDDSRAIVFFNDFQDDFYKKMIYMSANSIRDVVLYTPDYYYYILEGGKSSVYFSKGLEVYPFEQFDLKYNRPDIILDRLGYADSYLVEAYHSAYQKRLKKMGFTEDMLQDDFHLPEIEIENFEEMPNLHDQGSINLKLNLHDSKYKLDRINVWVNDVAIYGTNGISLRDKNVQEYTTNLEVFLAKGNNKVQVSVLNQSGAESYKETFEVECTVGKTQPDLYLITIGESEFQQADFNLTYAAKDAKDMAALFEKSKVYANVHTKTLVNKQVTAANVKALKSFLQKADINDEVMVFIAGHGILDANLDYYFATYDMDFEQPQDKGLAYEALEGLLDGIKPLKKTLLIDACHSGEIDKEEVELAAADLQEEGDIQFRAVGNTVSPKLGMQSTSELTKSLFTDLRKGTGATIISSAGGMEFAMEGDDWKNGLFTYCFIKGIESKAADLNKDGEIWLSEIKQYVSQQVYELSAGRQQPTSRIENQTIDFRVW